MRPLAVIATMHGKERVLGPLLQLELDVDWALAPDLDTDLFGTFTGEVVRRGTQIDAARAKAQQALKLCPKARFAVASEGSFGPHPHVPLIAGGYELVLLLDRETGQEILGHHVSAKTNYRHAMITCRDQALAFAEQAGFPTHALIIARCPDGDLAAAIPIEKAIRSREALVRQVAARLAEDGRLALTTDMRAHLNPTRMDAIAAAGRDLAAAFRSRCPACQRPGFVVKERMSGQRCADCGAPTRRTRAEIRGCDACGHSETTETMGLSDPTWCDACNP